MARSTMWLAAFCAASGMPLVLVACGARQNVAGGSGGNATTPEQSPSGDVSASPTGKVATIGDGPDVCFRAVAKHIGADAKVSEVTSFFSAGPAIDGGADEPLGQLKTCTVQYQDPGNAKKLLEASMDVSTGQFRPSVPVEISVASSDAASFRLEEYLIPLSKVNAAGLASTMDGQKARLRGVFSSYAWTGVRLESPGSFNNRHMLRLDLDGRLASNDIRKNGYASVTLDGKTITTNYLM